MELNVFLIHQVWYLPLTHTGHTSASGQNTEVSHFTTTHLVSCVKCGVFGIGDWTGLDGTNYLTPERAEHKARNLEVATLSNRTGTEKKLLSQREACSLWLKVLLFLSTACPSNRPWPFLLLSLWPL